MRGIFMAMVTTLLWGFLPVILKVALNAFSAGTIACFRFVFAFVILYLILSFNGSKPYRFLRKPPLLGILAGASLAANYFGMTQSVNLSSPSNAAILIQLAPVIMVIVGVTFFKERMTWQQLSGFAVAPVEDALFNLNMGMLTESGKAHPVKEEIKWMEEEGFSEIRHFRVDAIPTGVLTAVKPG